MAALSRSRSRSRLPRMTLWFERGMAVLAIVNLVLVGFDLSYIRFRDLYLKVTPEFTQWYGETFKGIVPERTTTAYLALVDDLENQVAANGLNSNEVQQVLVQLRSQSVAIIDENPFQVAEKSGTLERIKNLMRDRLEEESSKQAFREFWSKRHLTGGDWNGEIEFFNEEIRPLMETNYFRGIGESGNPTDRFWTLDIWFMAIFALEFFARTYTLSRRHENTTWIDAMLWRIYDVPMFLGFWRWLRVVPTVLRLNQSDVVDLEPIRNQANRIFISQFAIELTEVVVLRVLDQVQNLLKSGDLGRWLVEATNQKRYIDLNGVDEVQTISQQLVTVVVDQVLPKIKPELDDLLRHSVTSALAQTPPYQGLKLMPGFDNFSDQVAKQVVSELSKNLYGVVQASLKDEEGGELTAKLVESFTNNFREEIQKGDTLKTIQSLGNDWIDEVKLNYVQRLAAEDSDKLTSDRYRLYGTMRQK